MIFFLSRKEEKDQKGKDKDELEKKGVVQKKPNEMK